jgi:GT2 family glycosyltransferase
MKITAVIVIYKQSPSECKTLNTLSSSLAAIDSKRMSGIEFIVYDNSPSKHDLNPSDYPGLTISYVHDSRNLGIATAYNYALSIGRQNEGDWVLLFDHDTEVTPDYIDKIFQYEDVNQNVAALVPQVISGVESIVISPVRSNSLRAIQNNSLKPGLSEEPLMAINSGALVRIKVLEDIGGFNNDFPLDYLDHWLFHEIYEKGYYVWVIDTILNHDLSVMDYNNISLERYKSISDAEMNFYKIYKPSLYKAYKSHLLKRYLKQLLLVKNKKIALYTLKKLFSG